MNRKSPYLKHLLMHNILSFGGATTNVTGIELGPLNILVGANGSGKSNFIDIISLLRAATLDISLPFRHGEGVEEWIWKGDNQSDLAVTIVSSIHFTDSDELCHYICFYCDKYRLKIYDENINTLQGDNKVFYDFNNGNPASYNRSGLFSYKWPDWEGTFFQSVLSRVRDETEHPEIVRFVKFYSSIRIYRDLNFPRSSPIRNYQSAALPGDFLLEDGSNLALVLSDLEFSQAGERFQTELEKFIGHRYKIKVQGGAVQLFLHQGGSNYISAQRMSDGTLRYLCLLAILLHPNPPPLICIEEPELGLHPDMIPTIAELLMEASQRTQLIVTTHSDILVDALSEMPEAIVVCDRDENGTRMKRLDRESLGEMLTRERLGHLWLRGELGGTRW